MPHDNVSGSSFPSAPCVPAACLDSLPVELHREISEMLHFMSDGRTRDLIALSLCSKYWREQCLPMIFRHITLEISDTPHRLSQFIEVNTTNYGRFVTSVHLDLFFDQYMSSLCVRHVRELVSKLFTSIPHTTGLSIAIPRGYGSIGTKAYHAILSSMQSTICTKLQYVVVTGLGGNVALGSLLAQAPKLTVAYLDSEVWDPVSSAVGFCELDHTMQLEKLGFNTSLLTTEISTRLQTGTLQSLYIYGQEFTTAVTLLQSLQLRTIRNLIIRLTAFQDWNPPSSPFDLSELSHLSIILSGGFLRGFKAFFSYLRFSPIKRICVRLRGFFFDELEEYITRETFPLLRDMEVVFQGPAWYFQREGGMRQQMESERSRWNSRGVDLKIGFNHDSD